MEIEEAKRRARNGPMLLLARRVFAIILGFASAITVAHLVAPRDYGLANMSGVMLAFAQVFRDFGLTNAVLRKGTISQSEMSFIFWFNVMTTLALAVLIAAISPFAAQFYHEPIVTWVILASLIGFLAGGFSGQHRSLMNRELRFGDMAMIDAVSLLVGFLTSLGLAMLWHNVWAIVAGNVLQSVVGGALFVIASRWKPDRPSGTEDMRSLLGFGLNSSVFSISVFLSNNAASIIIGHFMGSSTLGQYNRAQTLFQLPSINLVQPITQATMPLLTRLRAHPEEYRIAYLQLVRRLCSFLMPTSVAFTFAAVPLVEGLLGEKWQPAGFALAALAPALAVHGISYSVGDLFVTQDRAAEMRTLGIFETIFRVGAVLIGVWFGLVGAALGFTLSLAIVVFVRMIVVGRRGPVSFGDQVRAAAPAVPMAIGALIGSGLVALVLRDDEHHHMMTAISLLAGGGVGAMLVALPLPASRNALVELAQIFGLASLYNLIARRLKVA